MIDCNSNHQSSSWVILSLVPRPPSTLQEEKGSGEYSTPFLYLPGISAAQSDWLIFQLYWASLPQNHLALLITPLQTYLSHLQFTEAQQATSKAIEQNPWQQLAHGIAIFTRPSFPLWRRIWE